MNEDWNLDNKEKLLIDYTIIDHIDNLSLFDYLILWLIEHEDDEKDETVLKKNEQGIEIKETISENNLVKLISELEERGYYIESIYEENGKVHIMVRACDGKRSHILLNKDGGDKMRETGDHLDNNENIATNEKGFDSAREKSQLTINEKKLIGLKANSIDSNTELVGRDAKNIEKTADLPDKHERIEINGYTYIKDELGRTISAEGKLRIDPVERDQNAQLKAGGNDRLETDNGGHLIANRFGGEGDENLVAQDEILNKGPYKRLESEWAKAVENSNEVYVKVEPEYRGESERPDKFRVSYTINGEKHKRVFTNKPKAYEKKGE